jgi:hypothetical protein
MPPIVTRENGDSIIYEFVDATSVDFLLNINLGSSSEGSINSNFKLFDVTNVTTETLIGASNVGPINGGLITTKTMQFTAPTLYKLQLYRYSSTDETFNKKFICYVRNYHVAKLPSNTVIPFVANFSSSVTNYTATSLPTTITLPAPTSTVTWTQVLSYTTSNCVTYTEGANTLQDCDTLTTLFISNNNSNVNYTITYNRPAQDITSVKEVKNATSVVTYPNPCKDFIKVKFNTEQSILPIELPNGVYFVKNGTQTVKFIKE